MKQDGSLKQVVFDGQPPSGGCVLKLLGLVVFLYLLGQPPSGGCVLKQALAVVELADGRQPPSGGCVLKLLLSISVRQM